MRVLILNSGLGSRLGSFTIGSHKSLLDIGNKQTIYGRQLSFLSELGYGKEIVVTTGHNAESIIAYTKREFPELKIKFIYNPEYSTTNYIYSIYLAREFLVKDDLLLLHGDLVFDLEVLRRLIESNVSCVAVSSTTPLSEKDFKAGINKFYRVETISVDNYRNAISAQPLYKLRNADWLIWLEKIIEFCENGIKNCYAEKALNMVTNRLLLYPVDYKNLLCSEVDDLDDLSRIRKEIASESEVNNEKSIHEF